MKDSDDRVVVSIPKKEVRSLIRTVEDLKFIEGTEKGKKEIEKGNYKTLEDLKEKYGYN